MAKHLEYYASKLWGRTRMQTFHFLVLCKKIPVLRLQKDTNVTDVRESKKATFLFAHKLKADQILSVTHISFHTFYFSLARPKPKN
jgi:hypothetical protein